MADRAPRDRAAGSANGATGAERHRITSASGAERHRITSASCVAADGSTLADRDQTLADVDQTSSDSDQTAADSDQTSTDREQLASDRDQAASDRDQAASDRDLQHGGDADVHRLTRLLRDRSAAQREVISTVRVDAAGARDAVARARDLAALARDQSAAERDLELAAHDVGRGHDGRAVRRASAAAERATAAEARARAAADRVLAARDREQAARDRLQAHADREALLRELVIAETDALTGARTRAAGLVDLDNEIDRAGRTSARLAVAYVDVVALKRVNDDHGHAAGDELLQRVVDAIRGHLRSYDAIVRLGGDEFLCVMPGATDDGVRYRFAAVQAALAAHAEPCRIKVGFATLTSADTAAELIARADHELPSSPRR